MSLSEDKYREIVESYVAPFLTALGFRKRIKDSFYVIEPSCTRRVGFGFNKRRGEDRGSMTVTVCVGFPCLERFLSECTELSENVRFEPSSTGCTMATDLGHLASPFKYLAWELSPGTDTLEVGRDIVARIRKDGLTYFSDYGTLELAVAAWKKGKSYNLGDLSILYLAAYEWLFGDRENALSQLRRAVAISELPASRNTYSKLLSCLETKSSLSPRS